MFRSGTERDCREQLRLIDRHRRRLTRQLGRDVPAETAAVDWIEKYADKWREWRETRSERPFVEFAEL
ncbi:MAG: hypothetical protein AAF517_11120 [Planctomycetota bacterium]